MPDYRRSTTVQADPDELFQYLSKIENLPEYFHSLKEAHHTQGDEVSVIAAPEDDGASPDQTVQAYAKFTIDADNRSLQWSSEGEHDYHGELAVSPDGDGAEIAVTLHTRHDDDHINDGIDETLQNIKELVAAR